MSTETDVLIRVDALDTGPTKLAGKVEERPCFVAVNRKRSRGKQLTLELPSINSKSLVAPLPAPQFERRRQHESGDGLSYFSLSQQGTKRENLEDVCYADKANRYYSIFDGHGGSHAAQYASRKLHEKIVLDQRPMREAFLETDSDFAKCEEFCSHGSSSCGTTALSVRISGKSLTVAHVGDSRALLVTPTRLETLTTDHSASTAAEAERIQRAGGYVLNKRVSGCIAVSRAIGDFRYKRFVVADPDIAHVEVDEDNSFLVLGTDGLWGVVSDTEIRRQLIDAKGDLRLACRRFADLTRQRNGRDDASVLVVNLDAAREL
uniref:PPM-type phosphatase domain-containing protein n=1 Tax=Rhodosorus marinus TaxID=101924 RepID=A0A7S2ZL41_9RHOD|mmetsp:Transcript_23464/g.93102  ORF Transcript_23464/g.93102 Transcript_23464/m.93102 type:complete len:320 (+) Transcript_23464:469-1428(+)